MLKYDRLVGLLLAICLLLPACSSRDVSNKEDIEALLPSPPDMPEQQIQGDNSAIVSREVTLYFASEDTKELTTVRRNVQADSDGNLPRAVTRELLEALPSNESQVISGARATLEDVELSCGIATVRLGIDASVGRDDINYLLLCSAIANTLLDLDEIEAVNILTGNRSIPVCTLPTGVFTKQYDNIPAIYAQILSEHDRFPNAPLTRSAYLYFPAIGGLYLLCEVRELSFSDDDYLSVLIDALCEGSLSHSCCETAVPSNLELLEGESTLTITPDGERVLELPLNPVIPNYLALTGKQDWQLYGSLVLTLTSFLPDLDAVRISVDGTAVTECEMGNRRISFPDGRMQRVDFTSLIGSNAWLYFASNTGGLLRQECALSQAQAVSARSVLGTLITLRDSGSTGTFPIIPDGTGSEDVLGVSLDGKTANVNLSANFYALCQSLDAQQERQLIYAMVNTLTELDSIGEVRFLVEGRQVDTLVGDIYLRAPLLPDPGLVIDESGEIFADADDSEGIP